MYHKFNWTKVAEARNGILKQYEPIQLFLLYEFAKFLNIETFVDIGANIGAYSIMIASLDNVRAVHAFEPSPQTFAELKKNVALNKHCREKVKVYNTAVSESEGYAKFGIVGDYSGANSIISTSIHAREKSKNTITVRRVPLDAVLSDTSKIICLKIDVEGHESEALAGARNLLKNNRAIIQLEDYCDGDGDIDESMRELGYLKILRIGPDQYFSNFQRELSEPAVIHIIEAAAKDLIESNLGIIDEERPIRIKLSKNVVLEVSGALTNLARRTKALLRRKE